MKDTPHIQRLPADCIVCLGWARVLRDQVDGHSPNCPSAVMAECERMIRGELEHRDRMNAMQSRPRDRLLERLFEARRALLRTPSAPHSQDE